LNTSKIDSEEKKLLKKMLYCFKVQFSRDFYVTDTNYYEAVDSNGLPLSKVGTFSYKQMVLERIIKKVSELKRLLSEDLFDAIDVDIV